VIPAFEYLVAFYDHKRRPTNGLLLACGGKAEVIAQMSHGSSPTNSDMIALGQNILEFDSKIGERSAKGAMDRFERFGALSTESPSGKP
jgi:hypothetical protein